jgi:type IV pilus assembly protein PilF
VLLALALLVASVSGCTNTPEHKANLREAARINVSLGAGYMNQGDLELASEKLLKALRQAPDLAEAHWTFALLQMRLKNHEAAAYHFWRALELDPDDPRAHNNYGIFLCDRGRPREAVEHFLRAAGDPLYDGIAAAYANAGVCAEKIPDPEAAATYPIKD